MQIRTTEGLVEGIKCNGYTVYKGIPYAAPPTGDLRWKAPQPAKKYDGIYKADHFGNICWQTLPKADQPIMGRFVKEFYSCAEYISGMSEDCLFLNIWVPDKADGTNPVGFYIHGGGFGGGYSSEIEFDGEEYCRRGVILVTINYRVNIFGFLAHPELSGAKTIEELRALPAEEILRLNGELGGKLWQTLGNGMVIVPCVDGYVLPESVKYCYANGHMRQIPYMLGTVIDDLGSSPENIAADEPGLTHTENVRWSRKGIARSMVEMPGITSLSENRIEPRIICARRSGLYFLTPDSGKGHFSFLFLTCI